MQPRPQPATLPDTDEAFAQIRVKRVGEVHVANLAGLDEGVGTAERVVDQLVRHDEFRVPALRVDGPDRVRGDHRVDAQRMEQPHVGPIVDQVRDDSAWASVALQEQHLGIAELSGDGDSGRGSIGRGRRGVGRVRVHAGEGGEAGAAHDGDAPGTHVTPSSA